MSSKFLRPLYQGPRGYPGPQGPPGPLDPTLVVGPATATPNAIARYNGSTGKLIKDSLVTVDDTGRVSAISYRGPEYLDGAGVNGFYIPQGAGARIQLLNNEYKGLADRLCSHETDGTLKGTTATVSATGAAAFSSVKTGTINAPTQTVGLTVSDTAAADISFTGSSYADASKVGWVLQLADATGRLSLHNAGGGGGGGGSRDYDLVPSSFASATLAANSWDYYLNEKTPHSMTIDAVRLVYATAGSDSTRVAIYRGTDTTAVLVGESAVIPAGSYTSPWTTIPVAAVAGQDLDFSHEEPLVVAIALSGSTTSLRSISATSDTTRFWYNTTDSVSGGFPANPRTKTGSTTSVPCCRLIAA